MENGDIPDEKIIASAELIDQKGTENESGHARQARLNGKFCWRAKRSEVKPWIQADIGYQTYVSGVVTQGDGEVGGPDWVKTMKVSTFFVSENDAEVFVQYTNRTEVVRTL